MTKNWSGTLVGLMLAAGLAGCEGIGEGVTLRSLEVQPADGFSSDGRPERPMRVYPCLRDAAELIGTFTDGSKGGFTSRAQWRSSNPDAIAVVTSDDVPSPEVPTVHLARGSLLVNESAAPQTVTISAEFVGLTASMEVALRPMPEFSISPEEPVVAVGGLHFLNLLAVLDGRSTVVDDAFLRWSFDEGSLSEDGTDSVVDGVVSMDVVGGRVRGLGPDQGATLTARAKFIACSSEATRTVRVGQIVPPLSLGHEPGHSEMPGELSRITSPTGSSSQVNTSEALRATATVDFGGGSPSTGTVDLSTQIGLILDQDLDDNADTAEAYLFNSVNRITTAGKTPEGSAGVSITAQLTDTRQTTDTADDVVYESESLVPPVRVVERTLTGVQIKVRCAADPCVDQAADETTMTVEGFGTIQLEAHGTLTSTTTSPATLHQRITRHASWRSDDTGLARVSTNFSNAAGAVTAQVNPPADAPETVVIEVRSVGAVTDESKACDDATDPANDDPFCHGATLTIVNNPDAPVFCPDYIDACLE